MRLLPREEKFFSLFSRQVEVISEASKLLMEGAQAGNSRSDNDYAPHAHCAPAALDAGVH